MTLEDTYSKISLVTPSYNQAEFLEETILSVIDQKYPNLEYIIIDGGSTDGSVEIIKKYSNFIAYWISEKDKGMYDALNKGFSRSTGQIMGWINSDDYLHRNSLHLINKIFNDLPSVSWIQGIPNVSDENGNIVYLRPYRQYAKLDFVIDQNNHHWIQQESTFWRRQLYTDAGSRISTDFDLAGDFELWMRFFEFEKLYSVNTLLGSFRLTGKNSSTMMRGKYVGEVKRILSEAPLSQSEIATLKKLNKWSILGKSKYARRSQLIDYPSPIKYNFERKIFELQL